MRTPEQKLATKLRKAAERKAHHDRAFRIHPPSVRYAKQKKNGKKRQKNRQAPKLGIQ